MEDFTLSIESRSEEGSSAARRLRKQGRVPAVVYTKGEASISGSLDTNEFSKLARKARSSQVFEFKSENKELNGTSVIVKDIQQDGVKGTVLHVDFLGLKDNEAVNVIVPLKIVGEAPGVKNEGGVLSVMAHELGVNCLPKKIPAIIEVSIGNLALGQSIHAKEINLPEGVKLSGEESEVIATVVASRASRLAEKAAGSAEESEESVLG